MKHCMIVLRQNVQLRNPKQTRAVGEERINDRRRLVDRCLVAVSAALSVRLVVARHRCTTGQSQVAWRHGATKVDAASRRHDARLDAS